MEIPICSSSVSLFVETIGAVVQNDFALLLNDSGMKNYGNPESHLCLH